MSQQQQDGVASTQRSASKSGEEKSRISVIEKSVTHLLVATKTLLETLTRWSKLTANESEVSDVYVRLGYEFNIACRAFNSIGVETQDLGPVPDLLRNILEETLSGEPSQAHLDKYLPRIRDIIVNLLQGLKKKQQRLRQRHGRENSTVVAPQQNARQANSGDSQSSSSQDGHSRQSSRAIPQRQESTDMPNFQNDPSFSTRSSSSTNDRTTLTKYGSDRNVQSPAGDEPNFAFATPPSSLPPKDITPATEPPPYPQEDTMPGNYPPADTARDMLASESAFSTGQPRHGDALERLQRGGELERRASRRFSAYHIQKHLGPSTGIPLIPPAQNSPIPNRGRDVLESMSAVRVRGALQQPRGPSRKATQDSPERQISRQDQIPDENLSVSTSGPLFEMPAELPAVGSPYDVTPDDKIRQPYVELDDTQPRKTDDTAQPTSDTADAATGATSSSSANEQKLERGKAMAVPARRSSRKQPESAAAATSDESTNSKELTLFLQYKTKIKKFVLAEGYEELSIARLQLAFIEKFAWNTQGNGVDLPEIYIQDPVSGVRHELENLADVKNRSVLALNVDAVEEVKRHLDDGMGSLKTLMQDVRSAISEQQSALQRVSDKQQDANKDIARMATVPPPVEIPRSTLPNGISTSPTSRGVSQKHVNEIQTLRRDLAVMRQTYSTWIADMQTSMTTLREKAGGIKSIASSRTSFPSAADSDPSSSNNGRAYVNGGRKTLNSTSETLMTRVEELQDTVEDLRKDVVTRGVRPLPRQLETVGKEISTSTTELKKLQEFIKREKPTWTKIWKDELQVVCDDQNLLTYQEELCADLEADLEAAAQTFGLVQEATKQQNLVASAAPPGGTNGQTATGRSSSRTLNPAADPIKAKDGVLGEVRALQPNHETRLEAIERAEKLRQRELESRQDGEFKKELSGFVDEGKLKKSGGFEEAERMRMVRDEMSRKEVWERMNGGRPVGSGTSPSPSPAPEAAQQQDAKEAEKAVSGAAVPQPLDVADAKGVGSSGGGGLGGADGNADMSTTPEPRFEDAPEAPLQAPSSASPT